MTEKQLAVQSTAMRLSSDEGLNKVLSMWSDGSKLEEIRKIYAPKLSDGEFKAFVEMGISCGLNPFLREIWAIKYDANAPAQIFVGRDGYRKIISRNPNFDGIIVESVSANDSFDVDIVNGIVKHIPNIKDRGRLIGGYAIVYMRGVKIPYYVFVPIEEYSTGRSVWKDKPATMIKKVAEAQAIRMADQTCASTYYPDEMPEHKMVDINSKANDLNKDYRLHERQTIDAETGEIKEIETPLIEKQEPVEPEIPEAPKNDCPFTYDEVIQGMSSATDLDILTGFASMISQMSVTKEQHAELAKIYREKTKALKKLEPAE